MAENTNIEWADHTFNPWIGCSKAGPGCDRCYAEAWDRRFAVSGQAMRWGAKAERTKTSAANWKQPLRWNAEAERLGVRYRVFCASLADVFDNAVPVQWRIELMALILKTPHLDWLLLTKRIGNAAGMLETAFRAVHVGREGWADNVPPNVWIGATVCNQEEADRDIPKLLAVPAEKRFLSIEPLLGPVDLGLCDCDHGSIPAPHNVGGVTCPKCSGTGGRMVDWVIVGGESGPGARPAHPDWARSVRDLCQAAGVPFMFKQWGEWMPPESPSAAYPGREWRDVVDASGDVRPVSFVGDRVLESSRQVVRVGKKAAGRLLDGVEHNGRPS
jgi:protein gp37